MKFFILTMTLFCGISVLASTITVPERQMLAHQCASHSKVKGKLESSHSWSHLVAIKLYACEVTADSVETTSEPTFNILNFNMSGRKVIDTRKKTSSFPYCIVSVELSNYENQFGYIFGTPIVHWEATPFTATEFEFSPKSKMGEEIEYGSSSFKTKSELSGMEFMLNGDNDSKYGIPMNEKKEAKLDLRSGAFSLQYLYERDGETVEGHNRFGWEIYKPIILKTEATMNGACIEVR